jgi:hypothetical protein
VHIIDFKTSKNEEKKGSLQLPIYHLLVHNCQKRQASKASYWYLDMSDVLTPVDLPDINESHEKILTIAKKIKTARQLEKFDCPHGEKGCWACQPMEAILKGEADLVGVDEFRNDIYVLKENREKNDDEESMIL